MLEDPWEEPTPSTLLEELREEPTHSTLLKKHGEEPTPSELRKERMSKKELQVEGELLEKELQVEGELLEKELQVERELSELLKKELQVEREQRFRLFDKVNALELRMANAKDDSNNVHNKSEKPSCSTPDLPALRQPGSNPSEVNNKNCYKGRRLEKKPSRWQEAEQICTRRKEAEGALRNGNPDTDSPESGPIPKHRKKGYPPLPHEANLAHELLRTVVTPNRMLYLSSCVSQSA